MIQIYTYIDYRKFLSDILKEKKDEKKRFSHRSILKKMGITSTGYIANVISGKSTLSIKNTVVLGRILNLSKMEITYFKKLIYFAKAKTIEEKNDCFEQIMVYRKRKMKFLDDDQLSLFKEWYVVVIREILHTYDFKDDYLELARMVKPSVTVKDAKYAISLLENIKLIEKNDEGIYKPIDKALSTGDEIQSFHVSNFQSKMLNLAQFSLKKTSSEDRDISGLTLSISREKFRIIKEELQEFRKKILQIASEETDPEQVFRCDLHLFPVSNRSEKKKL